MWTDARRVLRARMRIQDCGFVYAQQVRLIPEPPSGALRKHQRIALLPSGSQGSGAFRAFASSVPVNGKSFLLGSWRRFFIPALSAAAVSASRPGACVLQQVALEPWPSSRGRGLGLKSAPGRRLRPKLPDLPSTDPSFAWRERLSLRGAPLGTERRACGRSLPRAALYLA